MDSIELESSEILLLTNTVLLELNEGNKNIQRISIIPFSVTYLSASQLEVLKILRKSFLVLHVGPLDSGLETQSADLNKVQRHSIVASNALGIGCPPSLCEFVAECNSVEALALALKPFRST